MFLFELGSTFKRVLYSPRAARIDQVKMGGFPFSYLTELHTYSENAGWIEMKMKLLPPK
jgi:hypothetical protein